MLLKRSANHQDAIATHSPRLIGPDAIGDGARLSPVAPSGDGSTIFKLGDNARNAIGKAATDLNNPHWIGIDAREVFFAEDAILVCEGQEDVVLLPSLAAQVGMRLEPALYGWGAGGASKLGLVCRMLKDLGIERVIGLLDGDTAVLVADLQAEFPMFRFFLLPADDVRDKPARSPAGKPGLSGSDGAAHPQHASALKEIIVQINAAAALDVGEEL